MIRQYRGFEIVVDGTGYGYRRIGSKATYKMCFSEWSCIVSIDEELAP